MTALEELTAETITGEHVLELRKEYGMGRADFAHLCGYPGPARITNIETKNGWKRGDQEKVLEGLHKLAANPPRGPHGRKKGETGAERAERLDNALKARGLHVHGGDDVTITIGGDDEEPPSLSIDVTPSTTTTSTTRYIPITPIGQPRPLTNSEVGVWQRCRRMWWLAFYRKLAPKYEDFMGLRATGIRVHRALAAWYVPDGQERTDPREALERAIVEDWTKVVAQERLRPSYVDDETSLGDLAARWNAAVSLERAMVEGYVDWLAETAKDAEYRVVDSETPLSVVVEGEVAGELVSFTAQGMIDVRLVRTTDGVRLFKDHKTVGNFAQKKKMLHMDPQMLHYHLLEFLSTEEGEKRCDGALYNMLRRVKRGPTAKEPFYERVEVHHNPLEIEAYRRRLLGAARDIMRTERELDAGADHFSVAYPHPTDDCTWDCDFYAVCSMFEDGSRVDDAIAALYKEQDPMARYDRARNGGS